MFPNPIVIFYEFGSKYAISTALKRLNKLEKGKTVIEEIQLSDFFELTIGGPAPVEEKKSKKAKVKKANKKSPVANGKDGYLLFGYKLKSPETAGTRLLNYLYRNLIVFLTNRYILPLNHLILHLLIKLFLLKNIH